MKPGKLFSTIAFVVLLIVLFITNPKEYQLQEHIRTSLKDEGHEEGGFTGAMQEFFSGPESWLMSLTIERKNCYFFSIYTVEGLEKKHKYIGILSNFIELPS